MTKRRHKIQESAKYVFSTKGYSATSIKDICDHAGIHKGAMFYYYKTKKSLFLDVFGVMFNNPMNILHKYDLSPQEAKEVRLAIDLIDVGEEDD